jgi:hypothetical protein
MTKKRTLDAAKVLVEKLPQSVRLAAARRELDSELSEAELATVAGGVVADFRTRGLILREN